MAQPNGPLGARQGWRGVGNPHPLAGFQRAFFCRLAPDISGFLRAHKRIGRSTPRPRCQIRHIPSAAFPLPTARLVRPVDFAQAQDIFRKGHSAHPSGPPQCIIILSPNWVGTITAHCRETHLDSAFQGFPDWTNDLIGQSRWLDYPNAP